MEIETQTIEFLRAGPRHNQLLSPITSYLAVCGESPASRVTIPFEHGELERRLQELRYGVTYAEDRQRARRVFEQTGRDIAQMLSSIDGVAGLLNPKQGRPKTLTHLRIVLSASELAMLPFEASKVPTGTATAAGSAWLALQTHAPVCITRHIREVSADDVPWPTAPRVLFITGPETPVTEHRQALSEALHPWRDANDSVEYLLKELAQPTIEDIEETLEAAVAEGAPFTHVHLLAHGTPLDETDRYSSVGLVLKDDQDPVSGERLASALTSVGGTLRPAVVTLASCDSGQQVDVRTSEASIAHELHDVGIPLVVASQFPLTIKGSVPFVARFYEGQLRGEHPLVSLYSVRRLLHSRMDSDEHDWASLVVYEALPADLASQLESLCYWQARRALDGELKRLEAMAERDHGGTATDKARKELLRLVDERIAELPTEGQYALDCAGLRASAHKRVAITALDYAADADEKKRADTFMGECRRRLSGARVEYWRAAKAFISPKSGQNRKKSNLSWLLGQVISLDVIFDKPLDKSLLGAACLAAEIDLDGGADEDRIWAHLNLAEFNLLRLSERGLSDEQRAATARKSLDHVRDFLELLGPKSEQAGAILRQFERYVTWWGNTGRQHLLDRLGIPERPHWHAKNGLVPAAIAVIELLNSAMGPPPSDDAPPARSSRAASSPPARVTRSKRLSDHFLTLDMLPAENGDCLLLEYGNRTQRSRVLIDCGATSSVPAVASRLGTAGNGKLPLDLFVLTHIDADHINGVLKLFDQQGLNLSIGDIWFNGWRQVNQFLGVRQAEEFSNLLEDPKRQLPWNRAFSQPSDKYPGAAVIADGAEPPTLELPGKMQLTLLSPGPAQLKKMAKVWKQALLDLNPAKSLLGRRKPPAPVTDFRKFDLKALAATPAKKDPSAANGSTIALLAEYAGRSVLLTGDAHADVLVSSIGALQRARGLTGRRLKVDALKLSHHGSANATTIPLLEAIECSNYLVSTNGNHFHHPDRESIARVILHGGERPTLHFNYRTDFNSLWDAAELKKRYKYLARYPENGAGGLRVDL